MKTFWIRTGSINSVELDDWHPIEAKDREQASLLAWEEACDDYESYVGLHGTRSTDEIMEEDGVDSEEAWAIFTEERESYLDYEVREDDPNTDENT